MEPVITLLRFTRALLKGMFSVLGCGVAPTLMRMDIRTQEGLGLDWQALGRDVYHGVKGCDERHGKKKHS